MVTVLDRPVNLHPWRTRLNRWARETVDAQRQAGEEFNVPELAQLGIAQFGSDADFVGALLQATVVDVLEETIHQLVQRSRTGASRGGIPVGNRIITPQQFQQLVAQRIEKRAKVWLKFVEHLGNGRQKSLLAMTRVDLLEAANEREQQAGVELGYAKLWRSLARDLNDDETVGDHYTVEQIQQKQDALIEAEIAMQQTAAKHKRS